MALFAFDGTWNEERDAGVYGQNTNVVEFAKAYDGHRAVVQKPEAEGGPSVHDDFYVSGVGTRHGRLGRWLGGAFGIGGRTRIQEAKRALAEHFAAGDEDVDIVGFSRGAALALHFANTVGGMTVRNRSGNKVKPQVRFLGLWDVVAAFGIPIDLGPLQFQRINIGYKLRLPDHVKFCFHAIALDERRDAFRVTRVDNGYQVWFRGVHSDVGGGNENWKLSNISLIWMLRKALAVGLPVDPRVADALKSDASANIRPAKLGPMKKFREIRNNDRIHYTVSPRAVPECQNAPDGCPRESGEDERQRILTTVQLKEEARRMASEAA
jgi:uncharacterized protein (DUF2235 family)